MTAAIVATLAISGDVDLASVDSWREIGTALIANADGGTIAVDLARVAFIDSIGLALLVYLHDLAQSNGGSLAVLNVPTRVRRLFEITGLVFPAA